MKKQKIARIKPLRSTQSHRKPKVSRFAKLRFIPALALTVLASVIAYHPASMQSPARSVLAYATNVSPSGLLTATNTQRSNNSVSALSSNSALNAAAQTKAEDMANRNYWSHNTPDGQQPWVFISNAGYQYTSAGENLAYGFMTSNDTVTGWMNSAPHKANLLSVNFTEVGFGIANSVDFVGDGPQTIVVAMYGKPQVASAQTSTPAPAATTKPTAKPPAKVVPATEPEPEPVPEPAPIETPVQKEDEEIIVTAPLDTVPTATASPARIERARFIFGGWLNATAVILAVCSVGLLWALHKGFHIKRYLLRSEHVIAHHMHLDLTVLAFIYLGFVLLSNGGIVR